MLLFAHRRLSLIVVIAVAAVSMLILQGGRTEAVGADLVISQVYGGGGNSGAQYQNDFVELFNRGSVTLDLTGFSLQYASSAGNFSSVVSLLGSIDPGQY